MAYYDEEILRDKNGNPIPQYYDTAEGKFKPLTEVQKTQLTGSIVELARGLNVNVSPTNYGVILRPQPIDDFKYVVLAGVADSAHDYSIQVAWLLPSDVTFGPFLGKDSETMESNGSAWGYSGQILSKTKNLTVYVTNRDTVDHQYDLFVYGVR